MARRGSLGKAGEAARAAQGGRFLHRLMEDEELRANLFAAYGAARSAYGRMNNGKAPTKAILEDRKLQHELKQTVEALRDVSNSLREEPKPKRRRHRGLRRTLVVLVIGGALTLALSEELRSKLLDLLFGAEEEFDYTATTAPAEPAPTGATAA